MADPYMVEPAKSGRSTCKVSKETIEKGEVRFGSLVDIGGHTTYHWRKLKCITGKQVENLVSKMGGLDKVGGFDALSPKQQKQVLSALNKASALGAKVAKAKAKVVAAKAKAKATKEKQKEAKAKAKAKILAAKEAKKAKALKGKPAAATVDTAGDSDDAGTEEPPAKKARVAAEPEADSRLTKVAHKAMDLAKDAKWKDLFSLLGKTPEVVNMRPEPREYYLLHHAAFHGSQLAVDQLIDSFGASAKVLTKSGKTVAAVAKAEGYGPLATHIEEKEKEKKNPPKRR